jgi:hypothetical protein
MLRKPQLNGFLQVLFGQSIAGQPDKLFLIYGQHGIRTLVGPYSQVSLASLVIA